MNKNLGLKILAFCLVAFIAMLPTTALSQIPSHVYNPLADINEDGKVSLQDLVLLAEAYGTNGTPINVTKLENQVTNLQTIINNLEAPAITYVSPITAVNNHTIIIIGHSFGSMPQTTNVGDGSVDIPNFKITEGDGSGWGSNWNAGSSEKDVALIGVYLLSWNDTSIVLGGFGSYLGQTNNGSYNCYFLQGDNITITVNNATFTTIVQPPQS
jgi:hypothetical protein